MKFYMPKYRADLSAFFHFKFRHGSESNRLPLTDATFRPASRGSDANLYKQRPIYDPWAVRTITLRFPHAATPNFKRGWGFPLGIIHAF